MSDLSDALANSKMIPDSYKNQEELYTVNKTERGDVFQYGISYGMIKEFLDKCSDRVLEELAKDVLAEMEKRN